MFFELNDFGKINFERNILPYAYQIFQSGNIMISGVADD